MDSFFHWFFNNDLSVLGGLLVVLLLVYGHAMKGLPRWRQIGAAVTLILMVGSAIYFGIWDGADPRYETKPASLQAPKAPPEIMTCNVTAYYNMKVMKNGIWFHFDGVSGGAFQECSLAIAEPLTGKDQ